MIPEKKTLHSAVNKIVINTDTRIVYLLHLSPTDLTCNKRFGRLSWKESSHRSPYIDNKG